LFDEFEQAGELGLGFVDVDLHGWQDQTSSPG